MLRWPHETTNTGADASAGHAGPVEPVDLVYEEDSPPLIEPELLLGLLDHLADFLEPSQDCGEGDDVGPGRGGEKLGEVGLF